jgi:arylsulfatase A-like enzyme
MIHPEPGPVRRSSRSLSRNFKLLIILLAGLLAAACGGGGGGSGSSPGASSGEPAPAEVPEAPAISKTPNILLIVADDLGYNDLSINNDNNAIDTPNLDQLAREGVRFTRHYATTVCSPARAALLTGQYPERNGYLPNGRGLSAELVTLPERLQEEGYSTWHIGKWHIGDRQRTAWPDHQGFDHWFGFLNQWRLAGKREGGELVPAGPRYQNPWLQGDSDPGSYYEGHLENILTDKAIEVLADLGSSGDPWFLNLWYYAPHAPISPAEEFAALYPDTKQGRYRALVNQLDSNIGRVLAQLEAMGALEETIVVVVSDNGGTNREIDNNAPFPGTKSTLFEGGLRTPLIIRWPDASYNRQVLDEVVSIQDLYPTLLDAVGLVPGSDLDGQSIYPTVRGDAAPPQRSRFWEHIASYSVLSADGRWRLYQLGPIFYQERPASLYDYLVDPTATVEIVPTPEELLSQLRAEYRSWYDDVHTVKARYTAQGSGGTLTGMDFLRTPGFGGYTFGLGFSAGYSGPLVSQVGIWDMSVIGSTVMVNFGDLVLSGVIDEVRECHSVVVTGEFYLHISPTRGPDNTDLRLYIDGREVASAGAEQALRVDDPTVATIVGDPMLAPGSGKIYPPVVLKTQLEQSVVWTPASFSEALCNQP